MIRFLLPAFIFTTLSGSICAQGSELHAERGTRTSIVKLDWNMVNSPGKTTYVLLRSRDGKNWSEAVTDRIFRKYSADDIFDYEDKPSANGILFYILRIVDVAYNTVSFSNMVTIITAAEKGSWVLYPNPVNDILMISFKGSGSIRGVINVFVQNSDGKTVIKFRSASVNRVLQIPVGNLPPGFYVAQISVENVMMMNQKFIKE
ncbi:MAG: T9SS type A sorting domain-containing protein [Ginsengibacter sp.]